MQDRQPERPRKELTMKSVRPEVQDKLTKIAEDSERINGCAIPVGFFESSKNPANTPLKKLVFRKGDARLKLYLTLLTKATALSGKNSFGVTGHTTKIFLNDMAFSLGLKEKIDLEPGEDSAKRRMERALYSLRENKLINYKDNHPMAKEILLLSPDGSGGLWLPEELRSNNRWLVAPIELWSYGWIVRLPASAIAIFLILKSRDYKSSSNKENSTPEPFTISGYKKRDFGFSAATWTRGIKVLKEAELLEIQRGQFNIDEIYRNRDSYILKMGNLKNRELIENLDQKLALKI